MNYSVQRSCAVTTARWLADFLGDKLIKDKVLCCQYIVDCEPRGIGVSEHAVPVAIFEIDAEIMKFYVRKGWRISSYVGIQSTVDCSYYKQWLNSAILKNITIPAAMQSLANPVSGVVYPDWLYEKVHGQEQKFFQWKLVDMFGALWREFKVFR